MWPENGAKRGVNEVLSCLNDYFSKLPDSINTVFLFSDACPGQNRNITMVQFLYTLVKLGRFQRIIFQFVGTVFCPAIGILLSLKV